MEGVLLNRWPVLFVNVQLTEDDEKLRTVTDSEMERDTRVQRHVWSWAGGWVEGSGPKGVEKTSKT